MKILLIDDLRSFDEAKYIAAYRYKGAASLIDKASDVTVARDLGAAKQKLLEEDYDVLLVDHDLGDTETCGADALKYLIDLHIQEGKALPGYVFAVSSNPAGIKKINGYANDIERLKR